MRAEVTRLCNEFVAALMDGDFDRAAGWAAPPISIASCTGQVILADRDAVADDIRTLWGPYHRSGTMLMRPHVIDLRSYAPSLCLADIEWRMVDRSGVPVRTIHSSYTFRDTGDGLKVVQIVSHNEVLQRPVFD